MSWNDGLCSPLSISSCLKSRNFMTWYNRGYWTLLWDLVASYFLIHIRTNLTQMIDIVFLYCFHFTWMHVVTIGLASTRCFFDSLLLWWKNYFISFTFSAAHFWRSRLGGLSVSTVNTCNHQRDHLLLVLYLLPAKWLLHCPPHQDLSFPIHHWEHCFFRHPNLLHNYFTMQQ